MIEGHQRDLLFWSIHTSYPVPAVGRTVKIKVYSPLLIVLSDPTKQVNATLSYFSKYLHVFTPKFKCTYFFLQSRGFRTCFWRIFFNRNNDFSFFTQVRLVSPDVEYLSSFEIVPAIACHVTFI